VTGLAGGLSQALGRWRLPRSVHDPAKVVLDLVVAVALGGDCLADVGVLRAEPALFGPVASDPVVTRLITRHADRIVAPPYRASDARLRPGPFPGRAASLLPGSWQLPGPDFHRQATTS
jgi:hypothetical protein